MTRSREGSHFHVPDREDFSISEEDIRVRDSSSFTEGDFGSCFLSEDAASCDMIRVDMRIEDIAEAESEFRKEPQISFDLISHRIDDDGFTSCLVTDDIGIGPSFFIKKLAEDN